MSKVGEEVKTIQKKSFETRIAEMEKQESTFMVFREKNATRGDFRFSMLTMNDTAELGATSYKENTDYKKKRNANIKAAKKLTKKATAYTLELKDQLDNVNSRDLGDISSKELLMRLEAVEFVPEMFYSDMILKNFTEYMGLVRYFDTLQARGDEELNDRMERLKPVMGSFKNRMRAFLEANRLTLSGKVLGDKEKAFSMDGQEMKGWYDTVETYSGKVEKEYDPAECELNEEQIDEILELEDTEQVEVIQDPLSVTSTSERIKNLNQLKKTYEQCRKLREQVENEIYEKKHPAPIKDKKELENEFAEFDDLGEDFEDPLEEQKDKKEEKKEEPKTEEDIIDDILQDKQDDHERLSRLKQDELEARGMYLLAQKEALYNKARLRNDPKAKDLLKSLMKTRADVQKIRDRHAREEIRGSEGVVRQSRSVIKISKHEAISTDSDRKSYEWKLKLSDMVSALDAKIPKDKKAVTGQTPLAVQTKAVKDIVEKLKQYAINTRYSVGYTAETGYLKDALKAIGKFYEDFGDGAFYTQELNGIRKYMNDMTNGGLDTSNIPPEKIRDFHGQHPVEAGAKLGGWKRNGILTTFSHWSSKTDTPLFSHEPTVNDLKQRMVSNCYMVSATATLCELSPEYIKKMIKDNGDGTVTVRLYQEVEDTEEVKADKHRLNLLRQKEEEDFSKDATVSEEAEEKRADQLITSLVRLAYAKSQNSGAFNFTGVNDKTEELLRAIGGTDTSKYSTVRSLVEKIRTRIPGIDEYIRCGTVDGEVPEKYDDLAQKIMDDIIGYEQADGGEDLEQFLTENRKAIELERLNMEAVYVRVDKEVPRLFSSDLLSSGALWMQMIERACAHLGRTRIGGTYTGYRSLWFGDSADVIKMFTGAKPEPEQMNDELFTRICNWKKDNVIYTTGSKNTAQGTDTGHAYSILGGYTKNGIRYVRLRNPYSQGSSSYDYGTGEDKLEKKEKLNFIGGSDESYGQFDIKWEDFVKNFTNVSSCRMDGFGPE